MLTVENLRKSFPGVRQRSVLQAVSFTLRAGEYIAIMGESGAGKSTLLNLIAGLDTADAGVVRVAGENLAALTDAQRTRLRRARMGFVFQAFHLLPHLTVARNVALPLAINAVPRAIAAERLRQMLQAVGMLERADELPRVLSGGEMQRVAIARALAHRPALVLADEPTGNLDAQSAAEVLSLLRAQIKQDHAAGILVTHSPLAAATADRLYHLSPAGLQEQPR